MPQIISPTSATASNLQPATHFLLPRVFLWNPMEQLSCEYKCRCEAHARLKFYVWANSVLTVHDWNGPIAVLTARYQCPECKATTRATRDLNFTQLDDLYFPFVLTKETGITKDTLELLHDELVGGGSFEHMASVLSER